MGSFCSVHLAGYDMCLARPTTPEASHVLAFFGADPDSQRAARAPGSPALTIDAHPASSPRIPGYVADHRDGPVRSWYGTQQLAMRHDLGATAVTDDATFYITLSADRASAAREARHLLFAGLSWWFERRDLLVLHAAQIAWEETTALILGATGEGKSTLALAALRSGWELHSDDLVIVDSTATPARSWGIAKRPLIDRTLARDLKLKAEPLDADPRGRVLLTQAPLSQGWRDLTTLIVVGHGTDDASLSPLDHAVTLDHLLDASLESHRTDVMRRQLAAFANLASLRSHLLLHDPIPERRAQAAARLLEAAHSESTAPASTL